MDEHRSIEYFVSRPQSLKESDDEQNLPKCLFLLEPSSDIEDCQSSPECLLPAQPVTDDYSSDDSHKAEETLKARQKTGCAESEGHENILNKFQDSSNLRAEDVKYLFYVDYECRKEEVCLKNASVEECLSCALNFTSNVAKDEFKFNGKTIKEAYKYWTNKLNTFTWITENETSNFHELSPEQYQHEKQFFTNQYYVLSKDHNNKFDNIFWYSSFVINICSLFGDLYQSNKTQGDMTHELIDQEVSPVEEQHESSKCGCLYKPSEGNSQHDKYDEICYKLERSEMVKRYLSSAASLLPRRVNYLRDSECKLSLPLVVQNPDLAKNSNFIEDRSCTIVVKPDGVFVGPRSVSIKSIQEVWMLVTEVDDPPSNTVITTKSPCHSQNGSPNSGLPTENKNKESETLLSPSAKICTRISQPVRPCNLIASPEYSAERRKYIEASIPKKICSKHCTDKIAGQHVLQLLAMAQQSFRLNEEKNLLLINSKTFAKAIGLFIVNEYVYFSRLLVAERTMWYLTTGLIPFVDLPHLLKQGKEGARPKVAYGNFRFDLTRANHRKAFIIFLNHIQTGGDIS